MKNRTLVLIISLGCLLNACKNKAVAPTETENNIESKLEEQSEDTTTSKLEEKSTIPIELSSLLRPNEKLEFNKIYIDTVNFISFDDNYDYWYFLAQKNKDTIDIMYSNESISKLVKGDKILIEWEMKRLQEAGDERITYLKPYLVSFNKISSAKPTDKKVKVLWREDVFDEDLNTEINTIILNKDYLKNIDDPEKAALAYVATFIGNECEWDGKANENRSNLNCKLITALGLGYQCSQEHLGFLNKWFLNDPKILEDLKKCPTIPNTATIQSTFNKIELITNSLERSIIITYDFSKINVREGSVSKHTKTERFKYNVENAGNITLVKTDTNNAASKSKSFVISCGSGCAMTYAESNIVTTNTVKEITFKVVMHVNEAITDEYNETYAYTCNSSNEEVQIKLKGNDNTIEKIHPEILKNLTSYIPQLCNDN